MARVWAVAVVQAARARVVPQEAQGPVGVPERAGGMAPAARQEAQGPLGVAARAGRPVRPAWAVLERADPLEVLVA